MKSAQPSITNLPVSSSDSQLPNAEPDTTWAVLQPAPLSAPVSSFFASECQRPSASPATRPAKRRRGPDGQPVAFQECTAEAMSVSEAAGARQPGSVEKITIAETQQAEERRRAIEAATTSQDSNGKRVEGNEEDSTDVESDVEEKASVVAMKDQTVQCPNPHSGLHG
jgi:hypothetical protein